MYEELIKELRAESCGAKTTTWWRAAEGGTNMSIIIPGMEMPKSCFQCEFRTKIDPDNLMCIISQKTFEERFYHIEHRDQFCPLVPVPEHGDLIDRDETAKTLAHDYAYAAADMVRNEMPTIIPASGGKENE